MKYLRNVLICTLSLALMIAFTGCSKEKGQKTMSSNIPTAANGDTDAMIKKILAENDKKSDNTKDKYKNKVSIPISKNAKLSDYNFKQNVETTKKDNSSNASSNSNSSGHRGQIIEQPTNNGNNNPNHSAPNTTPNVDDDNNDDDFDYNFDDIFDDEEIVRSPAYNQLSDLLKTNGELNDDEDTNEYSLGYEIGFSDFTGECFINHTIEANVNYIDLYLLDADDNLMAIFYLQIPPNNENTQVLFGVIIPSEQEDEMIAMGLCDIDANTWTKDNKVSFEYLTESNDLSKEEKEDINSLGQAMCCNMINTLQQCLTEHETGLTLKDFGFSSYMQK